MILGNIFDCLGHYVLLAKLHLYGLQGTFLNWFIS